MNDDEAAGLELEPTPSHQARHFFARAEAVYLAALRIATLLIASAILLYVTWLLVAGIYNISRNVSSVEVEPAEVTAQELAKMSVEEVADDTPTDQADASSEQRKFYNDFVRRYHAVYARYFEPYRQPNDSRLALTQFDTAFVNVAERLAAIRDGDLVFSTDRDNLNGLLKIMTDAAALPETKAALSRYKASNRVRVVKQVRRTRNERYCYYYGAYIDECLLWDTRRVPYTANQVTYELPKGVVSHRDLFERYQTNYLGTMSERADGNLSEAALARDEILEANIRGGEQLRSALFAAGSFLAVMFFFLIIAIERHQRKIARHLDSTWPSDLSG